MSQAIVTKYHGPTDTKGSRIKATCGVGSVWFSYESRYNSEKNHALAILKLLRKLGWRGNWTMGGLPSGFCAVDHSPVQDCGQEVTVDTGTASLTFRDLEASEA